MPGQSIQTPPSCLSAVPEHFLTRLRTHDRFVIASHEKPDGDCIFSSIALASFLKRIKKQVLLYNPGPFARREIRKYKSAFVQKIPPLWNRKSAALLLVDCAAKERAKLDDEKFEELELLIIDHHQSALSDNEAGYICPQSPASALLVQNVIENLDQLTKEESYYLLLGFLTDSGFFRHISHFASSIFSHVTRLLAHNHSLRDSYRKLFGDQSFNMIRFTADIVSSSQSFLDGRLIIAMRTKKMSEKYGIAYMSNEQANAQLQLIKGAEVVALITELSADLHDVSLRALRSVNVAQIAEEWGGGGHIAASGFRWKGSLDAVQMQLIHRVGTALRAE